MMKLVHTAFVVLAGLVLTAKAATIEIETCDDLASAVAATAIEDTTATIITSAAFSCGNETEDGEVKIRTFTIENNVLTIEAPDLSDNDDPQFFNFRFALVSSGELLVTRDVEFDVTIDLGVEANGGWLHIEEGSKARFLGDVSVTDYMVRSETDEDSDFSSDQWDGGCVWNQGYFRVEGHATFLRCDNVGGGENSPGKGGAVYNGDTGSILFTGGVTMEEIYITDDEGNAGAGIYNLGKVNIKGDSVFQHLSADPSEWSGGAIYNAEGAKFTFRNKAAALFVENRAASGAAVFNRGEFRFSGPAVFALNSDNAIYNRSPGYMKLSSGSSFWMNEGGAGGAVATFLGATLDYPDDLSFVSNGGTYVDCDDIYVETDDGFECFP